MVGVTCELDCKRTYGMTTRSSIQIISTIREPWTKKAAALASEASHISSITKKGQAVIQSPSPTHQAPTMAATGHHAPTSGWWCPDDERRPARYVQEGDIMPSLDGSRTHWTLVRELPP